MLFGAVRGHVILQALHSGSAEVVAEVYPRLRDPHCSLAALVAVQVRGWCAALPPLSHGGPAV